MSSSRRSPTALVIALLTLTSCASSGPVPAELKVDLPPVPADLHLCFAKGVPAPAPGPKSKRELFKLIAELKASGDDKSRCGERLADWYEDIARGFAAAGGSSK